MNRALALPPLLALLLASQAPAQTPRLQRAGGPDDPTAPLAFVVHGINPRATELDPLACDVAARGWRTHLFHYDDRQALRTSADELAAAIRRELDRRPRARALAVVAHSMGGLVARHALTDGQAEGLGRRRLRITLLTIASPFNGFRSANMAWMNPFGPASHRDLARRGSFVSEPGALGPSVRHVKVETNEEGRRLLWGGESQDDSKIPLDAQRQRTVDGLAHVVHLLEQGHVGSVWAPPASPGARPDVPACTQLLLTRYLGPRLRAPRPLPAAPTAAATPATGGARGAPAGPGVTGALGRSLGD